MAPSIFIADQMLISEDEMDTGSALEKHFQRLKERFPDAAIQVDSGKSTHSVHIPELNLPVGWNLNKVAIWFTVPDGYPSSSPDCFWSTDLRLTGNREPVSSNTNTPHPLAPAGSRWYSWHVKGWSPITHDLVSYVSAIRDRLGRIS